MFSREAQMRVYFKPDNCILSNDERSIKITIQEARCLMYFVKNEGKIIKRETLLQECWVKRGVTVSDSAVRQSLYRLRRALEDAGLPTMTLTTQARKGHILQKGSITIIYSDANMDAHIDSRINHSIPKLTNKGTYGNFKPHLPVTTLLPIAKLLLLFVVLFLSGFCVHQKTILTDIKYHYSEEKEGRFYFYPKNQFSPQSTIARIDYWLKKKHVNYDDMKFVYLSNAWTGNTSFYLCNSEIGSAGSDCTSVTIVGEHHP